MAIAEWHNTNEDEGAECPIEPLEAIGFEEDAVAFLKDEVSCATWAPCTVIGGYTGAKTYTCIFEGQDRNASFVSSGVPGLELMLERRSQPS